MMNNHCIFVTLATANYYEKIRRPQKSHIQTRDQGAKSLILQKMSLKSIDAALKCNLLFYMISNIAFTSRSFSVQHASLWGKFLFEDREQSSIFEFLDRAKSVDLACNWNGCTLARILKTWKKSYRLDWQIETLSKY